MMTQEQIEQRVHVLGQAQAAAYAEEKALIEYQRVQQVLIAAQRETIQGRLGYIGDELTLLSNTLMKMKWDMQPGDMGIVTLAVQQWIDLNRSYRPTSYRVGMTIELRNYDAVNDTIGLQMVGGWGFIPMSLGIEMRHAWETANK